MPLNYSKIIAGTMTWGSWGKELNTHEMADLISHCTQQGITTFDHADIYGDYSTEAEFGLAFKESKIKREQIQLITKCGIQYLSKKRTNKVKHYNYSKEYIIWSVENSLKNLQTEYVNMLLLHRPSPLMQVEEILEAITQLQSQGKIKEFGVSNFTPSQVDLITSEIPVSVNQIECSLTHTKPLFDGTLDQCIAKKITPMAWSPLGKVFKENIPQTERVLSQLEILEKQYNVSKDQLLLAWLLKHPSGIYPVIGTTNKERIKLASQTPKIELDLEDWFQLLVESQGHKVP